MEIKRKWEMFYNKRFKKKQRNIIKRSSCMKNQGDTNKDQHNMNNEAKNN